MNYFHAKRRAFLMNQYNIQFIEVDLPVEFGVAVNSVTLNGIPFIAVVGSSLAVNSAYNVLSSLPSSASSDASLTVESLISILDEESVIVNENVSFSIVAGFDLLSSQDVSFRIDKTITLQIIGVVGNSIGFSSLNTIDVTSYQAITDLISSEPFLSEVASNIAASATISLEELWVMDSSFNISNLIEISMNIGSTLTTVYEDEISNTVIETLISLDSSTRFSVLVSKEYSIETIVTLYRYALLSDYDSTMLSTLDSQTLDELLYKTI